VAVWGAGVAVDDGVWSQIPLFHHHGSSPSCDRIAPQGATPPATSLSF